MLEFHDLEEQLVVFPHFFCAGWRAIFFFNLKFCWVSGEPQNLTLWHSFFKWHKFAWTTENSATWHSDTFLAHLDLEAWLYCFQILGCLNQIPLNPTKPYQTWLSAVGSCPFVHFRRRPRQRPLGLKRISWTVVLLEKNEDLVVKSHGCSWDHGSFK